jgi:low affinity Fe/Cu permease
VTASFLSVLSNDAAPSASLFKRTPISYIVGMANDGTEKGFHVFATQAANWVGNKWAFLFALLTIIIWLVSGPYFQYSDTWQLIINTGTTVVTFLVVFLIQNTQNRDARAIHDLKLDEIIKSIDQAQNEMIDIEHLSDDELQKLADKYQRVREECEVRSRRDKRSS